MIINLLVLTYIKITFFGQEIAALDSAIGDATRRETHAGTLSLENNIKKIKVSECSSRSSFLTRLTIYTR